MTLGGIKEVFMNQITFFAPINQDSFNGLINAVSNAVHTSTEPLDIHFASGGGDVAIAFRMYEYFRSLNHPVIMRNFGDVSSCALIPFLAADCRLAQPNSVFVIHRLACELKGSASIQTLNERIVSLQFDIDRYNNVFRSRTSGAPSPIDILPTLRGASEIVLGVNAAVSAGILTRSRV